MLDRVGPSALCRAQQHQQVPAAAASRPFMCGRPVAAIQTPAAFILPAPHQSTSRGDATPLHQDPGPENAWECCRSKAGHDAVAQNTRCTVTVWQHPSQCVSQKPHFGCNEAHCVSLHCMGCGSARSLIGDFTLLRESSTPVIESLAVPLGEKERCC